MVGARVGMDGDEQVSPGLIGDGCALLKRNERIALARVDNLGTQQPLLDALSQPHGNIQAEIFLYQSGRPYRAGISASVAGINHDPPNLQAQRAGQRVLAVMGRMRYRWGDERPSALTERLASRQPSRGRREGLGRFAPRGFGAGAVRFRSRHGEVCRRRSRSLLGLGGGVRSFAWRVHRRQIWFRRGRRRVYFLSSGRVSLLALVSKRGSSLDSSRI